MGKVKKYTSFLHTNYSNATQRKKICEKDRKQLYLLTIMSEAWEGGMISLWTCPLLLRVLSSPVLPFKEEVLGERDGGHLTISS